MAITTKQSFKKKALSKGVKTIYEVSGYFLAVLKAASALGGAIVFL